MEAALEATARFVRLCAPNAEEQSRTLLIAGR
jgi:hypothetical protein